MKMQRSIGVKHQILALWETNSTQQVIKNMLEYPEINTNTTEEFENMTSQVAADSDDLQQNASTLTNPIASSSQAEEAKSKDPSDFLHFLRIYLIMRKCSF